MNDDLRNDHVGDSDDLGAPVTPLEGLEEETDTDFFVRIRTRINRRTLASQSVDLSFVSLFELFRDYVEMFCQALLGPQKKEDE